MKFRTTIANIDETKNWSEGIVVPNKIAQQFLQPGERPRLVAALDGQYEIQCSLIPLGGRYMIYLSQEKRKKFNLHVGDEFEVELRIDESKYGIELPEEWEELMAIDPKVDEYFHTLKPGQMRNILHAVGSPKRPETRVKKAIQIGDYLRENQGHFDYRELAAFIKAANAK